MSAYTRVTRGMAIAVVLATGTWAAGQSQKNVKKNGANPPAESQAGASTTSGQKGSSGSMQSVKSNPMFKDNQNEGSMPQTVSRDPGDKGPNGAQATTAEDARYRPGNNKTSKSSDTVEYKDPEDMTTRYRPGNNKTSKAPAAATNKGHETVEYKDPEDMTTKAKAPAGKTPKPN